MKRRFSKLLSIAIILTMLASFITVIPVNAATETSTAPSSSAITVYNYAQYPTTTKDKVKFATDTAGTLKIYKAATGTVTLGSGSVSTSTYEVELTTALGDAAGGSIYVSFTESGKDESSRTSVSYSAATKTITTDVTVREALNRYKGAKEVGKMDKIIFSGVDSADTVKLYKAASGGKASKTYTGSSQIQTVTGSTYTYVEGQDILSNLTTMAEKSVWYTVQKAAYAESARIELKFTGVKADTLDEARVSITNNENGSAKAKKDKVCVSGVTVGDVVTIYNSATTSATTKLGSTTVTAKNTVSGSVYVNVKLGESDSVAGSVYVTVRTATYYESEPLGIAYDTAEQSVAVATYEDVYKATVINDIGKDLVIVWGLETGDKISVYKAATGTDTHGTATVGKNQTFVAISITKAAAKLSDSGGTVYITRKKANKLESVRVPITYSAQPAAK